MSTSQVDQGSADACSALTLSLSSSQFSCADIGPNTVTLYAADAAGNTSACETTVQVLDALAPVIQCPDLSLDLGPFGEVDVSPDELGLQANDLCGTTTWHTSAALYFNCQQANTTVTILFTAQDSAGNTASCTLHIFVTDTTDTDADGVRNCLDACPNDSTTSTLLQFFPDADMDGFGSGDPVSAACVPPPGTSGNNLDCDDTNPNIYPGAVEIVDSLDNNCNGKVDEIIVGTGHGCRPLPAGSDYSPVPPRMCFGWNAWPPPTPAAPGSSNLPGGW